LKNIRTVKIISAIILILMATMLYIFIHGTNYLIIFKRINEIIPIVPMFDGVITNNKFITGYLVDILWYTSFLLFINCILEKRYASFFVLGFAVLLEFSQLFNPLLGTFDLYDILIYILITLIFVFLITKPNKGS